MRRKIIRVNSYLTKIAYGAIIRNTEKRKIRRSISTIQSRLDNYFPSELANHFLFGSYTRETMLPRKMDSRSDIDYMVVFKDSQYQPQTYLDRLSRFVNHYYSRSEIFQSNPTIILELNHIRFELVPAITRDWPFDELLIPAKASNFNNWINTDPHDFNQTLIRANRANHNMIKPTVRLVKYWNAQNNYIFESYELEKTFAEEFFWEAAGGPLGWGYPDSGSTSPWQLKDYFFYAMGSLQKKRDMPNGKRNAICQAHEIVQKLIDYQEKDMEELAMGEVQKLIPPC